MEVSDINILMPFAAVVTTIGTAYLTVRKIARDTEKTKKEQKAEILQEAKEDLAIVEKELKIQIDNMQASFDKDLQHIRETYNGEIRNLGEKIEEMRIELRSWNSQVVQLLTKMVTEKD